MKSVLFASVLAIASIAALPHGVREARASDYAEHHKAPTAGITEIDIIRIKTALRLTAAQQPLWEPVEATLLDISRQQKVQAKSDGFIRHIGRRAVTIALSGAVVTRLATAARPFVASLSETQKQAALQIAQEMGLGPVIANLN
jgi:hypothetical protein